MQIEALPFVFTLLLCNNYQFSAVKLTCQVGPWSRWSPCSVSCGEGSQTRRRRVVRARNDDWEEIECDDAETEVRQCTGRHQC